MHQPDIQSKSQQAALALAALGVVYGDIGTSPLYTMKEVFAGNHPIPLTPENVLGILSLILWSLIIVVSVKYVVFVMRADNRGEGGIMALIALALHDARGKPAHERARDCRRTNRTRAPSMLAVPAATPITGPSPSRWRRHGAHSRVAPAS